MRQENTAFHNQDYSFVLSYNKVPGHYTMPVNHFHNKYEIYYLLSGERYYFIKDRTFRITQGSLLFINTLELHKTTDTGIPGHERILIQFEENFISTANRSIDTLLSALNASYYHVLSLSSSEQQLVQNILFKMLEEAKHQLTDFEVCLQSLLMQLVVFINRYVQRNKAADFTHLSPKHEKVSDIVQYINTHYMEPLTIASLSEHFYISRYYLSRIFKESTGFTFVEYLNSIRVKEAQKLLLHSQYKISQISEKTGFGSIAQFNRIFKKITGLSPSMYKKQG